jgi:hypothetical protein
MVHHMHIIVTPLFRLCLVQHIADMNAVIAAVAAGDRMVYYLDCSKPFLGPGGWSLRQALYSDFIHPSAAGRHMHIDRQSNWGWHWHVCQL